VLFVGTDAGVALARSVPALVTFSGAKSAETLIFVTSTAEVVVTTVEVSGTESAVVTLMGTLVSSVLAFAAGVVIDVVIDVVTVVDGRYEEDLSICRVLLLWPYPFNPLKICMYINVKKDRSNVNDIYLFVVIMSQVASLIVAQLA
jgi:hypothetical protein